VHRLQRPVKPRVLQRGQRPALMLEDLQHAQRPGVRLYIYAGETSAGPDSATLNASGPAPPQPPARTLPRFSRDP
jgi:hypothetical protein